MDGKAFEAIEDCTDAIGVAISDLAFGLNKGYVGYGAVLQALLNGGMTKQVPLIEKLGKTFPDNLKDRKLLNDAIASALTVQIPQTVGFEDRSLFSMVFADLGLVDYDKLAFLLFGFRIEALYYLYFTILGTSVGAFVLAHRRSRIALAVPLLFLAAGNLIIGLSMFDIVDVSTVANSRFLSTLGILPGLHLIILMLERQRLTGGQFALALLQAAIFCLAISTRSALVWLLLFIVILALLQVAVGLCRFRVGSTREAAFHVNLLLRQGLWPAVVLVAAVWGHSSYVSYKMHPSYELDDVLPHHMRYHNAFLGLLTHPKWYELYAKDYQLAGGDALGFNAGIKYLKSHYDISENYYVSRLTGTYRIGLHDRMVRGAYLSFVRQHPWFVVEAHVAKLKRTIEIVAQYLAEALRSSSSLITLLAASLGTLSILVIGPLTTRPSATVDAAAATGGRLLALTSIALPFSWLPSLYAYPATHVIGDQVWFGIFAFLLTGWFVAILLAVTFTSRVHWLIQRADPAV
jgi:hypothetical protein